MRLEVRKDKEKAPKKSGWSRFAHVLQALVAAAVIALGAVTIAVIADIRVKLDELGNQMLYLQDTTDIIQTNVDNMEANIEATLEEEASLIEEYSIVLSDCDFASGTYDVDISVIMKEYTDSTKIGIYFGTQEYQLELDGFSFCGTATLPMDVSYDGNVTILSTDGDRRSTEVLQNYVGFQQSLSGILSGGIANFPRYQDGTLTIRDNAAVYLNGNDIFSFTDLKLIATADGQEIYNYDLLANTGGAIGQENVETEETDDETEDEEEAVLTNGTEIAQNTADIAPVTEFSTERELNLEYELEADTEVRIFLSAETTEGYRFAYDLFNGVTSETEESGFMPSDDYFASNYAMYDRKGAAYVILLSATAEE